MLRLLQAILRVNLSDLHVNLENGSSPANVLSQWKTADQSGLACSMHVTSDFRRGDHVCLPYLGLLATFKHEAEARTTCRAGTTLDLKTPEVTCIVRGIMHLPGRLSCSWGYVPAATMQGGLSCHV